MTHQSSLPTWYKLSKKSLVVLVFTLDWSGGSHIMGGYINNIKRRYPDLHIEMIDIGEQFETARYFGVNKVPTIILLKGEKVVEQAVGTINTNKISSLIEPYL